MIKLMSLQNQIASKNNYDRKIENIAVNLIKPNPYQPRKDFTKNALEELSKSISEYGVIQPITVRKTSNGGYELVTGERRLRASKMAGLNFIPAIIINTDEQDSAIIAMIENLQRENLHFIEEAKGYASLIKDHGFTQEQVAQKLGKNQSTIANKLRILKLSDNIKDIILQNNLTERHARALLKLPDEDIQLKVLKDIIERKYNVKDTEIYIEKILLKIQRTAIKDPVQKKIFKARGDLRIFVNTIKNAVNMMKDYGLTAQFNQVDKGDNIEITVTIPKG